ncbi:hypothetical protein E2C01_098103 [Portunus trituberculatus]|uniref:Uncharacterized protein n=1 Tax=Portunus trituberculatus TaxID=210409 RepID=A0A5B7K7D5_PORTR|nr:hypothetical protein [Portunus trituberculatus]
MACMEVKVVVVAVLAAASGSLAATHSQKTHSDSRSKLNNLTRTPTVPWWEDVLQFSKSFT